MATRVFDVQRPAGRRNHTSSLSQSPRSLRLPVVGTLLLLSVHRDLVRVRVQRRPPTGIHRLRSADQRPAESCQARKVLLLGQHLRLEGLQSEGQRRYKDSKAQIKTEMRVNVQFVLHTQPFRGW